MARLDRSRESRESMEFGTCVTNWHLSAGNGMDIN